MRKFIYSVATLAILCSGTEAYAKELSAQEALSRGVNTVRMEFGGRKKAPSTSSYTLKYTAEAKSVSAPAYYVFGAGDEGFMIVSADDRLPAVLGYSGTGKFNYENLPENLKWWLGEYKAQIDSYLASPVTASAPARAEAAEKTVIQPLVKSQWNQSAPYNNDCPEDANGRSVTGCAATAIAQIINYHRWPATTGTGTYSYQWNSQTLSFDYGATTFDWANMLDTYDSSSPAAANAAVAKLMYACGVGINMDYSSDQSGAATPPVPRMLVQNMGYDAGVHIVDRNSYSMEQWQDLIYSELAANRPVFYTGRATNGGHAFVCDGYDGNENFHINWGWGGAYDGYFRLNALNPAGQGIGGFEGGYNSDQEAVIGIKPDQGSLPYPSIICEGDFTRSGTQFLLTSFYNSSYFQLDGELGILVVDDNGMENGRFFGDSQIYLQAFTPSSGSPGYQSFPFTAVPSGLSAGEYKVYPCVKTTQGVLAPILAPYTSSQYINLTVGEDGSLAYNGETVIESGLAVTEFVPVGKVYSGEKTAYSVSFVNNSAEQYSGDIRVSLKREGTSYGDITFQDLTIAAYATPNYTFSFALTGDPGDFEVNLYDKNGKLLNVNPFIITLEEGTKPVLENKFYIVDVPVENIYYDNSSNLPVYMNNNTGADFTLKLMVKVYKEDGTTVVATNNYNALTIPAGYDGSVDLPMPNLHAGTYILEIGNDGEALAGETRYTIRSYEKINGVWYGVGDGKANIIVEPFTGVYNFSNGILEVPEEVTIDSVTYPVTSIMNNAFKDASGLSAVFLNSPVAQFENGQSVFSGLSSDVVFYVAGAAIEEYKNILSDLGNIIYTAIKSLEYIGLGGNPRDLTVGKEYKITVSFVTGEATRSEDASLYVNPELNVTTSEEGLVDVTKGEFANGAVPVSIMPLKEGSGSVIISSAQPGEKKSLLIPVTVNDTPTGVSAVKLGSFRVLKNSGEAEITGLKAGETIEIYDLGGVMVKREKSDGGSIIFRPASRGVYVLKSGDTILKISF